MCFGLIYIISCYCFVVHTSWLGKLVFVHCQGLYSFSGRTSYHKISWSLEAALFGPQLFQSRWQLTDTSAAALPWCLSNANVIRSLKHPTSQLRIFTRFGGKTLYWLVNRGPDNLVETDAGHVHSMLIYGISSSVHHVVIRICLIEALFRSHAILYANINQMI